MQIIIDGKVAALKTGSSFEFIAENRLFSGSDSYTLTITFPLRDCPRNIDIFGHIYRSDSAVPKYVFDCELRDKTFSKFGTLTIVDISEVEVKAQFLEGRSEQNFADDFDETYINELTLGSAADSYSGHISPAQAWDPATTGYQCVALPWVSASSGMTHNFADYNSTSGTYSWIPEVNQLSWQPYLLHIAKKICEAVGYDYDFSAWQTHPSYSRLLVCNSIPAAWDMPDFSRALPHWTVDEFFERLELFLSGEFDIDHRAKKVTFAFSHDLIQAATPVRLSSVVDEYSANVKTDGSDCSYLEAKNIAYKDHGHQMWQYYSCDWFLKMCKVRSYNTVREMMDDNRSMIWPSNSVGLHVNSARILHAVDIDTYFIVRAVDRTRTGSGYNYINVFQPVNEFGQRTVSEDDDDTVEIEFAPACIDYTDQQYGFCLFCSCGSYSEDDDTSSGTDLNDKTAFLKTLMQSVLERGEKSEKSEYYSMIHIGYYDGYYSQGTLPVPEVSNISINYDTYTIAYNTRFSLRLNTDARAPLYNIDRTRRVTFKFLSDTIPSPRALFFIKGKRYVCEKITATFSESGMSQLLKGEFFALIDD